MQQWSMMVFKGKGVLRHNTSSTLLSKLYTSYTSLSSCTCRFVSSGETTQRQKMPVQRCGAERSYIHSLPKRQSVRKGNPRVIQSPTEYFYHILRQAKGIRRLLSDNNIRSTLREKLTLPQGGKKNECVWTVALHIMSQRGKWSGWSRKLGM